MSADKLIAECREPRKGGNWNPESSEHWEWLQEHGAGREALLALIKLQSIGQGSPYCVSTRGTALTIEKLAAMMGLEPHTAQNYAAQLETEGRIRTVKANRVFYRADVPKLGRTEGDGNSSVQRSWPPYLVETIESLPAEKKAWLEATFDRLKAWREERLARAVKVERAAIYPVEDSMYAAVGLEVKRLNRDPLPAAVADFEFSPLGSVHVNSSVHSQNGSSVQTGLNGSYKPPQASIQPRNLIADPRLKTERETSAPPTDRNGREPSEVSRLAQELNCNERAAATILKACRQVEPSITMREVLHLAHRKLRGSRGSVQNPIGLLIKTLALEVSGPTLLAARQSARSEIEQELARARSHAELTGSEPEVEEMRTAAERDIERLTRELQHGVSNPTKAKGAMA